MGVLDLGRVMAGTNPNLLDNWDFAYPINQHGIVSGTTYTSYMNFLDRWITSGGANGIIWASGVGVTMNVNAAMFQNIERIYTDLMGETYTATLKKSDGTYLAVTGTFPSSVAGATVANYYGVPGFGTVAFAFGYYSGGVVINGKTVNYVPQLYLSATAQTTIRSIKLEKGAVSTHAMDATMDYAAMIRKCMRYYIAIPQYMMFAGAHYGGNTSAQVEIPMPTKMRIAPTFVGATLGLLYTPAGIYIPTSISTGTLGPNGVVLNIWADMTGLGSVPCTWQCDAFVLSDDL